IAPQLSEDKQSVELRFQVPNPELRIKGGMLGEVQIPRSQGTYEAVMAPRSALLLEDGKAYVYRVNGQVAEKTSVKLGASLNGLVEVKGLGADDQIVLEGLGDLSQEREFIRIRPNSQGSSS
ncbi:MAG: hypothetical protein KDK66_09600, partial [Deltaproteobacteria bacterium]|nr:hypothetical protein [Deltaproteobacteria bacterium]